MSAIHILMMGAYRATTGDTTAPATVSAPHADAGSLNIVRQNFSEAIIANSLTNGDITVSGKTVSAFAISGTELQITVTAAFAYGETSNFSLAAGKLKDAAGNVTAAITTQAITNNAPSAVLSIASFTQAAENFTTLGYLDYVLQGDWTNATTPNIRARKDGANLLTTPILFGGATQAVVNPSFFNTLTWSDGKSNDGTDLYANVSGSTTEARYVTSNPGTQSGIRFTAPAGSATRKVRVHFAGNSYNSNTTKVTIRASLSNGAVSEQTLDFTTLDAPLGAEITYNAGAGGQTLTVQVEGGVNTIDGKWACVAAYTYGV